MTMPGDQPPIPKPKLRWFQPTPGKLLTALLLVEAVLLLSKPWFPKGWAVLIAIATVAVFLLVMLLWLASALLFRRQFQFSIRSMFVLTVAVAVPCSWLMTEIKWAREQQDAVDKLGGNVGYDYESKIPFNSRAIAIPPGPSWLRDVLGDDFFINVDYLGLDDTEITDAEIEHLKYLPQLINLSLTQTKITDIGLVQLENLNQLEYLWLSSTEITDAGLKHLKGLNSLQKIDLGWTKITDAGLKHLKGMNNLKILDLCCTKITDVGLEQLGEMKQLESLYLTKTSITDAGLKQLGGLKLLQTLYLDETSITDAGVEQLKSLSQLQELSLDETKITDAGLKHLQGLKRLQFIAIRKTHISDAGVEALRKVLPDVQIRR